MDATSIDVYCPLVHLFASYTIVANSNILQYHYDDIITTMMPKIATFVSSYALLWVAQHNQVDAFSFQLSRRESLALVGGVASVVAPNTLSIFPANAIDEEETVATTENATREEEAVTTTETATKEEEEPAPPPPPKYKSSLSEETPRSVTRMGGLLVRYTLLFFAQFLHLLI